MMGNMVDGKWSCFVYDSDVVEYVRFSTHPLLMGSSFYSSRYLWTPSSEKDYSYFSNLFGHALKEEQATLARYTRHTFAALALGKLFGSTNNMLRRVFVI